jgi:hypothetical protein
MSKIRMNTELRNKLFNKIKHVFENESTQEKEAMLEARENVDVQYKSAFNLATQIVERAYPPEDVATLRTYKKKYGEAVDVVAKDKCFYFAHNEAVDDDNNQQKLNHTLILVCLVIYLVLNIVMTRVKNLPMLI